jgi:hypothetical protein
MSDDYATLDFMSEKSIIDDHYLRLSIHHNHLHADIECLHHKQCEAAQRVTQDKAEHQNDQGNESYDIILEWFADSEAKVLRSGNISLYEDINNGFEFASWRYINDEHPHPDQVIDELRSAPLADHALVSWVKRQEGPRFDTVCTTRHPGAFWNEEDDDVSVDCSVLCPGGELVEYINSVSNIFQLYAGLENSEFRDDYITITSEYITDYWGEHDADVAWMYLTDTAGEVV